MYQHCRAQNGEIVNFYFTRQLCSIANDAIVLDDLIILTNDDSDSLDSTSLLNTSGNYKELFLSYKQFLDFAAQYLNNASCYHFKLEEIYKENVNFGNNQLIAEKAKCQINSLFAN